MEGLVKFREAFAEYSENYVVIGGAACDITMTNTVEINIIHLTLFQLTSCTHTIEQ